MQVLKDKAKNLSHANLAIMIDQNKSYRWGTSLLTILTQTRTIQDGEITPISHVLKVLNKMGQLWFSKLLSQHFGHTKFFTAKIIGGRILKIWKINASCLIEKKWYHDWDAKWDKNQPKFSYPIQFQWHWGVY